MQPIQPRPEAIIFDLDGTLADTFALIVSSWNAAVSGPMGRTYAPEEVIARFGLPEHGMIRRELDGHPGVDDADETFHRHYEAEHDSVSAFTGVGAMLHAVHAAGIPMGVMTGKGRRTLDITLDKLRWTDLFGSTVTGDDVVNQKPAPDGVEKAARELGAAPAASVYVGDSPVDIQAGKAAGMTTVAAAWHAHDNDRLRAANPDFWAETPADVLALLGLKGEG
jgi:HAD superfamily hydrolase (TIGR01509 family)